MSFKVLIQLIFSAYLPFGWLHSVAAIIFRCRSVFPEEEVIFVFFLEFYESLVGIVFYRPRVVSIVDFFR